VALLGASALGAIAIHRGEPLNAMWFVIAAIPAPTAAVEVQCIEL